MRLEIKAVFVRERGHAHAVYYWHIAHEDRLRLIESGIQWRPKLDRMAFLLDNRYWEELGV